MTKKRESAFSESDPRPRDRWGQFVPRDDDDLPDLDADDDADDPSSEDSGSYDEVSGDSDEDSDSFDDDAEDDPE